MQIIKSLIRLTVFICPIFASAQSTYLQQGSKEYQFIDRLEIKQQRNTDLNFSALKPYSRKAIVRQTEYLDSARLGYADSLTGQDKYPEYTDLDLTPIDEYNLHSLLMNNTEWMSSPREDFQSAKPIFNAFYKTKVNMIEVNNKDFFLAVNPVLQFQQETESNNNTSGIFLNTRGVTARGMIDRRVGFSAFVTENQERGPQFFQDRVNKFSAVPGVGFYRPFKNTGVDYFDARGYITFNAAKFIDFQFGYDKNFIGDGYRSLFLSDWGNSYLFLKINTRVWKLNYQNIFMELMPEFPKGGDTLLGRKYAAIHHLSVNVTHWLNLGLFESVVFGRKDHFDFQYLNPVMFYRQAEVTVGSRDNSMAGVDFKANVAHTLQFYGQFLLDEFILSEIKAGNGFWANKFGVQGGIKYIDAFNINNFDIQLETNWVRPFTYTHQDSIADYSHYNQPLAHPLGANFKEFIGIIKYQPARKWYINWRTIYFIQGLDSAGLNFGSNILRGNTVRPYDYGYKIGSGLKANCINTSFLVSYELKENLFLEGSVLYRDFKIKSTGTEAKTTLYSIGIRLNMSRRDYDF